MAITYPIDFPSDISVNNFTISARDVVGQSESSFNLVQYNYAWPKAEQWTFECSLPLMKRETAEKYNAFILKLKGSYGTFLFTIPDAKTPQGVATGTPLVKGAAQTGNALVTDGWTINTTGILKAGDYIQLGTAATTRLYKVLDDVNSNASGEATLTLWPELRSSPSDNQAVITTNCKGRFRLTANVPTSVDVNKLYSIQFQAVEAM